MNRNRIRISLAAAVGGAVLLAALLVGASFALAQDPGDGGADDAATATEETIPEQAPSHPRFGSSEGSGDDLRGRIGEFVGEFGIDLDELRDMLRDGATIDDIVGDLGIDLETMTDQLREKALDALDEAVAAGRLNEEQAARMREHIESFSLGDGFPFGFGPEGFGDGFRLGPHDRSEFGPRGFFGDGVPGFGDLGVPRFLEDLAERLGTTPDELRQQFESGKSLDEILDELGIDRETLVAEALEQASAKLDELVADDVLTEEQAAHIRGMLERFESEGLPFGLPDFSFDFGGHDFRFDSDFGRFGRGHGHGPFDGSVDPTIGASRSA